MTNYFGCRKTHLISAIFGVAVFVLIVITSGQVARASTVVPLAPEVAVNKLVVSDANCNSVTAELPVADVILTYYEYDSQDKTISQGQLTTDSLGLATASVANNTVAKIKFVYSDTESVEATISCQPTAAATFFATATVTAAKIATKAAETPAVPVTTAVVSTAFTVLALAGSAVPATFGFGGLWSLVFNSFLTGFAPKRDRYGFVFDATTQKPVPKVVVQLFNVLTSRTVASAITDKKGRYIFNASKGEYTIAVKKDGFVFPSRLLTSSDQVNKYYLGGKIIVSEENPAINYLIPIDPVADAVYSTGFFRRLVQSGTFRYLFMALGTGLAVYSLILKASVLNYIVMTAFLILWAVEYGSTRRFVRHSFVVDAVTNKPLALALVRTADNNGRLVETFISDQHGRVLPRINDVNQRLIVDKGGYRREILTAKGTGLVENKKFTMTKNI